MLFNKCNNMEFKFKGTGVAMITPFLSNGEIDYKSLGLLIDFLIDSGLEYILVMGTTAESACLSTEEKLEILEFSKKRIGGKVPLMYGIGYNNTSVSIETIKSTDFSGIDGILCVTPYYNKPNQTGLYRHYAEIAEASPVDIILYNVPGRTGVSLSPDTTLKLANDFKNIVATKEASGNLDNMMQIIKDKPEGFHLLSGDDGVALPLLSVGCQGVISVLANAFPAEWSEMIRLGLSGKFAQASKIHYKYLDSIGLMFEEGNPVGVKAFMTHLGLIENHLRLPLVQASEGLTEKIRKELAKNL